jgi:hypothetical protein
MENGLNDLVAKIFTAVTFIAVGGGISIVFFFVFAQVIFGSKFIHRKLDSLDAQLKRTNELLEQISRRLGSAPGKDGK